MCENFLLRSLVIRRNVSLSDITGLLISVGISSSISVSVGDTTTTVSVPAQSIYLPNHPFKTGQQITLQTDGNSAIQVSRDGSNSSNQAFAIPFTGSSQTLFAINKSPNYIGIVTQVGLTTSTNGLFFRSNGDNYFKYRFESNFNKVTGNAERINSRVSLTTAHNLSLNDIISLNIDSDRTVGVGTSNSVRVKYNSLRSPILFPTIFQKMSGYLDRNNAQCWSMSWKKTRVPKKV